MRVLMIFALVAGLAAPVTADARTPLDAVPEIDDGLLAVAIANDMRKKCSRLNARMVRAYSTLNGLKSQARALGYSDAEIDAYVRSRAVKTRMRARGEAWVAERGVAKGDLSRYCALGEQEVARGSAVGRLLRVNRN